MKVFVFIGSYAIGIASLYISAESYLLYLFGLFMYLALTNRIIGVSHRYTVIDPLILSFFSVMLISLFDGKGGMPLVTFMISSIFLIIFHQLKGKMLKSQNEKEEMNVHYYFKRLLLPSIFPIGFFFMGIMFVDILVKSYVYWMFYFLVIIYFTQFIATRFFMFYFIFNQVAINLYLFQYMDILTTFEKTLAIVFVTFSCVISYLQHEVKGGTPNLQLIRKIPRKQIQQSEDRPLLLERRRTIH